MSVTSKQKLLTKLRNKEYRDAYVAEHVKTSVPIQIRTLREQHGFTQSELARRAGMTQTVISRLEDPNYGNLSINSLLKLAYGLDVGLLIKFVPYSRLLDEFKDVSPEAIAAPSFDEEISELEQWAIAQPLTASTAISMAASWVTASVPFFPLYTTAHPVVVFVGHEVFQPKFQFEVSTPQPRIETANTHLPETVIPHQDYTQAMVM